MSGFVLDPCEGPAYEFHGATVVIKASGEHTLDSSVSWSRPTRRG